MMACTDEEGTYQSRVERARARHRPRLVDWCRDGFASRRVHDVEALSSVGSCDIAIEENLSHERFAAEYEATSLPVLVRGVPEREGWNAAVDWNFEALGSEAYSSLRLKCGEDDDGRAVRLSLVDFCRYVAEDAQGDDSPLYVFDSGFAERSASRALLLPAFRPPAFVGRDDLFELVGEKMRPPYRWILIGPRRSGTCVHVDPLGTAAWNTLLCGRKRWVLFEPGTSKRVAKGSGLYDWRTQDDEAVHYFCDILPLIRRTYPNARRIEFVQHAGDTVYVPPAWW